MSWGWFGGRVGKSISSYSEYELITVAALLDFFLVLFSLPVPLPFTCVLCTDFALGLAPTGTCVGV